MTADRGDGRLAEIVAALLLAGGSLRGVLGPVVPGPAPVRALLASCALTHVTERNTYRGRRASTSSTNTGSPGSTSGENRFTICPEGDTRNFSKFHLMSPS